MGLMDALLVLLAIACIGSTMAVLRLRRTAHRQRDVINRIPQTALTAFDRDLRVTLSGGSNGGLLGAALRWWKCSWPRP